MADLEEILGEREPAPVEKETPVEEQTTEQQPEAETLEGDGERSEQKVPVAALQKEREKAKRYTEQVAEFERKLQEQDQRWAQRFDNLAMQLRPQPATEQTASDPLDSLLNDPNAYLGKQLEPIREETARLREFYSQREAVREYGQEKVSEAYQALDAAINSGAMNRGAVMTALRQSMDPFGDIMKWHERNSIVSDPAAYEAQVREKVKAELQAEMQANGGAQPQVKPPAPVMPSNFATARNVGTRAGPAWTGQKPITDIFSH